VLAAQPVHYRPCLVYSAIEGQSGSKVEAPFQSDICGSRARRLLRQRTTEEVGPMAWTV